MEVKIKKLNEKAVIPSYAKHGDAGMDLTAITMFKDNLYTEYGTGLAVEIPEGYVGYIFPRSSASKTTMIQANCVGVIDSGYRGEILVRLKDFSDMAFAYDIGGVSELKNKSFPNKPYEVGDRIAQIIIMPVPEIQFTEVEELTETERGVGAFGSTNKQ